jgi:hypothetical protein
MEDTVYMNVIANILVLRNAQGAGVPTKLQFRIDGFQQR